MARRMTRWEKIRFQLGGEVTKIALLKRVGAWDYLRRDAHFEDTIRDMLEEAAGTASSKGITTTTDAVSKQAFAFAGLRIVRNTISSLPIKLMRRDIEVQSGKAYTLIHRPSEHRSMSDFLDESVMDAFCAGYVIWWRNPASGYLYVIPATEADPKPNQSPNYLNRLERPITEVVWLERKFRPDEIVFIPLRMPVARERGQSPLRPALTDVAADVAIAEWAKNMSLRGMRPNFYVKTDKNLTTDQLTQAAEWWEQRYSGTHNAGKPVFLDADYDVKALQLNSQEMQLAESRKIHQNNILVALGIAKIMVLAGEATYENLREAESIFWRYQGAPLMRRLAEYLTFDVMQKIDSSLRVEFDVSQVPAVRYLLKKASEGAKEAIGLGIDEIRDKFYGLPPVAKGETVYMPAMMIPVEGEGAPAPKKGAPADFVVKMADAIKGSQKKDIEPSGTIGGYTPEQRHAWWLRTDAKFQSFERNFGAKERKALRRQERLVIEAIENGLTDEDEIGELTEINELISWLDEVQKFLNFARPTLTAATVEGANNWLHDNRDESFEFTIEHQTHIQNKAKDFAEKVNKTTMQKLEDAVLAIRNKNEKSLRALRQEADEDEEIPEEASDKTKLLLATAAIYAIAKGSRTRNAARTNVIGAMNYGLIEGMEQGGVTSKQWVTNMDGLECEICMSVDGETVGLRESFSNGVVYPGYGDPHPNCRCTTLDVKE